MHFSLSGLFFGQPGEHQPQTDSQEENSRYVSGKSFQKIFLFVEITQGTVLSFHHRCGLGFVDDDLSSRRILQILFCISVPLSVANVALVLRAQPNSYF